VRTPNLRFSFLVRIFPPQEPKKKLGSEKGRKKKLTAITKAPTTKTDGHTISSSEDRFRVWGSFLPLDSFEVTRISFLASDCFHGIRVPYDPALASSAFWAA
jgi:hypothetical protein